MDSDTQFSSITSRGVQRHSRRRNLKCVTEILGEEGAKIRKLGGDGQFIFGQLILRKIIKIAATRCHILRLKCTEFDFGFGSAPDPVGGAHSAPTDPIARLKGSYF